MAARKKKEREEEAERRRREQEEEEEQLLRDQQQGEEEEEELRREQEEDRLSNRLAAKEQADNRVVREPEACIDSTSTMNVQESAPSAAEWSTDTDGAVLDLDGMMQEMEQ
jgi:hypothetical protein